MAQCRRDLSRVNNDFVMKVQMKTAFSYIRFSSAKQELGTSLKRQHEKAVAWCHENGYSLSDKSFRDLGISAFKDAKRPSLDDMLTCIAGGTIKAGDVIILESVDRLSRQGIDATQQIIRSILKSGVEIVDISNSLKLNEKSLDDPIAVIRIAIAANLAHRESQQKSQRVQAAKTAGAEKAKAGQQIRRRLPFWLSWKDGEVVLNDKSEIITMSINWRLNGRGLQGIAKDLNEKEHESPNGKGWSDQTVRYMFENPSLYGAYKLKDGTVIEDHYPAVTDYQTWLAIQPHRFQRAGGNSQSNPISGCCTCGICGYAFKLKSLTRKRGVKKYTYRYWVCRGEQMGTCSQKPIKDLDKWIMKGLDRLTLPSVQGDNSAVDSEIEVQRNRIKELESALAGGVSVGALMSAIGKCNDKIKELESKRVQSVDENDLKNLDSIDDPVLINVALKRIIKSIDVFPTYVKIKRVDGHKVSITKGGTVSDSYQLLKQIREMNNEQE